jgi:lipopolysaccharide heptosyltransferase II
MRTWALDRDTLARRNQQLAEAFHATPMRHKLRQRLITHISRFPFAPLTSKIARVLFIRPDHIGDVLLSTPAIRAYKEAQPFTEVHVLVGAWSAPILANYDEIDQVLTVRFPGFDRQANTKNVIAPYTDLLKISRQLRRIGYTSAVIMRPDHWWGAMLAHVAGIKDIVGYDLPEIRPFLTRKVPFQHIHAIRQNMRLVEHVTRPIDDDNVPYDFPILDNERDFIAELLPTWGIGASQKIICIHPGAGTRVKQWEAQKWAQVADALSEQTDAQIVFTGSNAERALIAHIQSMCQHKTHSSGEALSLEQLAALYERAMLVLGCDSGPLHIAAAVKTATVGLFGPADPIEFAQWGDRHKHIVLTSNLGCRPCRILDWGDDDLAYHPCVRDISIGEVLSATHRILNSI